MVPLVRSLYPYTVYFGMFLLVLSALGFNLELLETLPAGRGA